jgi:hypothetical protein
MTWITCGARSSPPPARRKARTYYIQAAEQGESDSLIASHQVNRDRCSGTGAAAAEPMALASWLPVRAGPTPHGLRHGHQTWLDDLKIRYILQSERMGHEVEGMRGIYSQITPRDAGRADGWAAGAAGRIAALARRAIAYVGDKDSGPSARAAPRTQCRGSPSPNPPVRSQNQISAAGAAVPGPRGRPLTWSARTAVFSHAG